MSRWSVEGWRQLLNSVAMVDTLELGSSLGASSVFLPCSNLLLTDLTLLLRRVRIPASWRFGKVPHAQQARYCTVLQYGTRTVATSSATMLASTVQFVLPYAQTGTTNASPNFCTATDGCSAKSALSPPLQKSNTTCLFRLILFHRCAITLR